MKDLEEFHFGEKIFHRNDSQGKFVAHYALVKEKFKYSNYLDKDEENFNNACNMNALNKRFRQKTITIGGKGSSSSTTE